MPYASDPMNIARRTVDKANAEERPFKRTLVTREGYLTAAMALLNQALFVPNDCPLPSKTRVTCGWPSRQALGNVKRVGEAWHRSRSADNTFEILISPYIDEPLTVLAVLAHEMVHVAVGFECGHRGPFKKLAIAIGLKGPLRSTNAGPLFVKCASRIIEALGPYPHAQLGVDRNRLAGPDGPHGPDTTGPKKDVARMIKARCRRCGTVIRLARKWISHRSPACPRLDCDGHDTLMEVEV